MLSGFQGCIAVFASPAICTFRILLFKKLLTDILVEFLMGLAVNKCDEFSVLNCQSSESILFFDNLTFHILILRSSNCKCNTIRVKNELLFID